MLAQDLLAKKRAAARTRGAAASTGASITAVGGIAKLVGTWSNEAVAAMTPESSSSSSSSGSSSSSSGISSSSSSAHMGTPERSPESSTTSSSSSSSSSAQVGTPERPPRISRVRAALSNVSARRALVSDLNRERSHTVRWTAVGSMFEKFVHEESAELLLTYPDLPREPSNSLLVAAFPENGLNSQVVELYMDDWFCNTCKPRLGFKLPARSTVESHIDLLYCASLRRCTFTMDAVGREAERSALEQSSMSYSHGGTKKKSNRRRLRPFVAQLLGRYGGRDFLVYT